MFYSDFNDDEDIFQQPWCRENMTEEHERLLRGLVFIASDYYENTLDDEKVKTTINPFYTSYGKAKEETKKLNQWEMQLLCDFTIKHKPDFLTQQRYANLYFDKSSLTEFNAQQKQQGNSCLTALTDRVSPFLSDGQTDQQVKTNLETIRLRIEKSPNTNLVQQISSCLDQLYQLLHSKSNNKCSELLITIGDSTSQERKILTQAIVEEAIVVYHKDIEGYEKKIQDLSDQRIEVIARKNNPSKTKLSMHFVTAPKIELYNLKIATLETQKKIHQMQYVIFFIKRSLVPASQAKQFTSQLSNELTLFNQLNSEINAKKEKFNNYKNKENQEPTTKDTSFNPLQTPGTTAISAY